MHTVLLGDLDAMVAEIGARGIQPAQQETYSNGVRKATYRDPDGNELGLGRAPLTPQPVTRSPATPDHTRSMSSTR
jgi:hypothetical protein